MGVFRKDGALVGYIRIKLSNLIDYFLKDAEGNFTSAAAMVSRNREVGIAVAAKFTTITKRLKVATVLSEEKLKQIFFDF